MNSGRGQQLQPGALMLGVLSRLECGLNQSADP